MASFDTVNCLQRFLTKRNLMARERALFSTVGRAQLWILAALGLAGCAESQTYPICLYDSDVRPAAQARADWPKLQTQIVKAASLLTGDPKDVVIVTSRAAVLRINKLSGRNMADDWPPIACFAEADTSGTQLRICENYVREYILARQADRQLDSSVLVPPCQSIPGDPAIALSSHSLLGSR
jgi:hypothetical protein